MKLKNLPALFTSVSNRCEEIVDSANLHFLPEARKSFNEIFRRVARTPFVKTNVREGTGA